MLSQPHASSVRGKHVRYPPGLLMKRHFHEDASLVVTLSGTIEHSDILTAGILSAGSILYLPPGEPHADVFGQHGASCFVGSIDPAWLRTRFQSQAVDVTTPRLSTAASLVALAFAISTEVSRADNLSGLIIECLCTELLLKWQRECRRIPTQHSPAWLQRVKMFLEDSFKDSVSLEDLSQVAGVDAAHVSREFHRIFGQTPGEFVRRLRVDFVAKRISSTRHNSSLADLAVEAGFSSHAHMTSTFRRLMRLTPSQYRRAQRS